jgi:hypothetical protein
MIIYSVFSSSYFDYFLDKEEEEKNKIKEYTSSKFDFSWEFFYHFIDIINKNNPLMEQLLCWTFVKHNNQEINDKQNIITFAVFNQLRMFGCMTWANCVYLTAFFFRIALHKNNKNNNNIIILSRIRFLLLLLSNWWIDSDVLLAILSNDV